MEGYSNFLWIIIAYLILKLKVPLIVSIKVISCLSLAGALICLFRFARLFFTPLLAILPVFLFSHYVGVAWWTVSGMESMFYCFLSLLFVDQCSRAMGYKTIKMRMVHSEKQGPLTSAWIIANSTLLLLCLTRFEAVLWIIPALLFISCQLRGDAYTTKPQTRSWLFISLVCFMIPYLLYFIWRLVYFGHWIPNSYLCKAWAPGQTFVVDLDYVLILIPLLSLALPYVVASNKDCRHYLLWVPSALYLLLLWKANPVITHLLRLFLAPFAVFSLLPVLGCQYFLNDFKQTLGDTRLLTVAIMLIATVLFVPGSEPAYLKALVHQYEERTQIRLAVADIINKQATKGASVLFGDCGLVPYTVREDIRFVDTDCLNNAVLTQPPFNTNYLLYAEHISKDLKPEWVITSYLPLQQQNNVLFDVLQTRNFFAEYRLITTLEAKWSYSPDESSPKGAVDYIYKVYKRKQGL